MGQPIGLLLAALLAAAFILSGYGPATAQETRPDEIPVTEQDLARISDSELRALILERLENPSDTGQPFNPAVLALRLQADFGIVRARLADILGTYDQLPDAFERAGAALFGGREAGDLGRFFLSFAAALAAGWLAERAARRRSAAVADPAEPPPLREKLDRLLGMLTGRLASLLLFAAVAVAVFLLLDDGDQRDRTAFAFYLSAIVIMRLIAAFARTWLALDRPAMRISAFTDAEARRLYRIVAATLALGAFGFFTCALFGTLGVAGDVHRLMLLIVGMTIAAGLAALFVRNRAALTRDLQAREPAGRYRRRFARAYPWAMAIGTVVIWLTLVSMTLLGTQPLFGTGLVTVGLLILWPALDAAAVRDAARSAEKADEITPAVLRVVRIGLAVGSLFLGSLLWEIDLIGEGAGIGAAIARGALEIGVVLLLAYAAWEALTIRINAKIAEEDRAHGQDGADMTELEIGGTGMSRLRTLLPLIKRGGQITIAVIAFMIVLSSLGVNIGPVLAGAGVVGIAIGFGSQTLVRDVVSGAFFLMDDAFRLGEYIDLGSVKGSVEKIGIRSLQLRHHRGALNTVPFGEIQTLTNYSRDWAIMKLRFRVPFDTDIEKTRKIVKNVGKELLDHPDIGPDFLQPFKSQGVVEVDDYGLMISTKFMCKPGKQFLIRRYAYAAVQKAFAENGIQFARPEVRVAVSRGEAPGPDATGPEAPSPEADEETARAFGAAALERVSHPKPGAAANP